ELARRVADGYQRYLTAFPEAGAQLAMLQNAADVLTQAGDEYAAGQAYARAAQLLDEDLPGKRDALYEAVVRFQDAVADEATPHAHRVISRGALRRAGSELLRFRLPAERERRVKFAMATTYYGEG